MQNLNLPQYNLKIKAENNNFYIFDKIRKKYYILTPEEWVRQNFAEYLIKEKKYPIGLMGIEVSLNVNNANKRCDIIIFNKQLKPYLIVECKAPTVKISQDTFTQVGVYNMAFESEYLVVTNGLQHYCCQINNIDKTYKFIEGIPEYLNN